MVLITVLGKLRQESVKLQDNWLGSESTPPVCLKSRVIVLPQQLQVAGVETQLIKDTVSLYPRVWPPWLPQLPPPPCHPAISPAVVGRGMINTHIVEEWVSRNSAFMPLLCKLGWSIEKQPRAAGHIFALGCYILIYFPKLFLGGPSTVDNCPFTGQVMAELAC